MFYTIVGLGTSDLVSHTKDLLHTLHQGVACVLIAALVCDHLECKHYALTLKQMDVLLSKDVYRHYRAWCHKHGPNATACSHRFSCLRFGKEKWAMPPELGSIFKAAVVKSMMYWCAEFLKENDHDVEGGHLRIHTMHAFAKFQFLVDKNGPFFPPEEKTQVVSIARKGLILYQKLTSNDRKRVDGRCTYKITPKFHSFFELSFYIDETSRNPRQLR